MRLVLSAAFLILTSFANAAARYVPANDSVPLLRRDLIPMDVDAIRDLASHLAVLADGPMPKSAIKLRHRAQVLTLSQRLLPGQNRARSIEAAYLNGEERPRPDKSLVKPALKSVVENAEWLSQLPKDSGGHHLGQLLLDLLAPAGKELPVLANHDAPNASKRWSGVIAKVSKFDVQDEPIAHNDNDPDLTPLPSNSNYKIRAILTETPMFTKGIDDGSPPAAGLVTTSLVITEAPEPDPEDEDAPEPGARRGNLKFQPETDFNVKPLHSALLAFFRKNDNALPNGYNLNINTNKRQYLSRNRENIAANIAMMLDAAVSGRPLRRNTILFARLRASGDLERPHHPWELLHRLEELNLPTGTRLIVGKDMIEEMTGMLVIEKASFFIKYEVLEATTFEEARHLFYDDGKMPEDLQAASQGYLEVRNKAVEATNLGTFLSLSTVEQRLTRASELSPKHLSAMMLAKQSVRRPAYFTHFMFAQELNRLLEPLSQFEYQIDKTPERAVKDAYKDTRDRLTPLKRRLERKQIDVLDDALNLIKDLNSVGRGASTILDNEEEVRNRDMNRFKKKLEAFRAELREIYQPAPDKDE